MQHQSLQWRNNKTVTALFCINLEYTLFKQFRNMVQYNIQQIDTKHSNDCVLSRRHCCITLRGVAPKDSLHLSGLQTTNFNSFLMFSMLPTSPAHLILLYLIKNTHYGTSRHSVFSSLLSQVPTLSDEGNLCDSHPGHIFLPRPSPPSLCYVRPLLESYITFKLQQKLA